MIVFNQISRKAVNKLNPHSFSSLVQNHQKVTASLLIIFRSKTTQPNWLKFLSYPKSKQLPSVDDQIRQLSYDLIPLSKDQAHFERFRQKLKGSLLDEEICYPAIEKIVMDLNHTPHDSAVLYELLARFRNHNDFMLRFLQNKKIKLLSAEFDDKGTMSFRSQLIITAFTRHSNFNLDELMKTSLHIEDALAVIQIINHFDSLDSKLAYLHLSIQERFNHTIEKYNIDRKFLMSKILKEDTFNQNNPLYLNHAECIFGLLSETQSKLDIRYKLSVRTFIHKLADHEFQDYINRYDNIDMLIKIAHLLLRPCDNIDNVIALRWPLSKLWEDSKIYHDNKSKLLYTRIEILNREILERLQHDIRF